MKTIKEILDLSFNYLKDKKLDYSKRDVEDLLGFVLKMKRIDLYLNFDRPLEESELNTYKGYLKRLSLKEPIQYIQQEVEFYNCHLFVSSDVLIPRQETELLVDLVVSDIQKNNKDTLSLWDLCTGSGCIGISIKKAQPQVDVTLSDLSDQALRVAEKNRLKNQVDVEIVKGDGQEAVVGQTFDYIVSNPPYVTEQEWHDLDSSVKDFEPKMALVAEDLGLLFYKRIAKFSKVLLNKNGKIFLEIGKDQGKSVESIFLSAGYSSVEIRQDYSNHDRFCIVSS